MWRHPNYYKNLRKLYRSRNRDQAISDQAATADGERAPGTGQQADKPSSSQAREQALRRQAVRESTSVEYDPNH